MKILLTPFLFLLAIGGHADAQEFPVKPVRIIVPFAPGGPNDLAIRPVAPKLQEILGQPFVVDYRAGANGIIGSELVAKSSHDGYTLLVISSSFAINASTYAKLPFDPLRDFAPVSPIATSDIIFVVNPTVPARNVREFIALAKSRPGKLNYASSGNGGSLHLGAELLKMTAGIDMVHVPYKGAALALSDVVGGHVDSMFISAPGAIAQIRAGKSARAGGGERTPNAGAAGYADVRGNRLSRCRHRYALRPARGRRNARSGHRAAQCGRRESGLDSRGPSSGTPRSISIRCRAPHRNTRRICAPRSRAGARWSRRRSCRRSNRSRRWTR